MAKLGSPSTQKYSIGTAEVRLGPQTSAMLLNQASHSIGVLDSVTVEVAQESVDLLGGFPQTILDTAIINQTASVTATFREYSRRNIRTVLGESLEGTAPTDNASLIITNWTTGTDVTVSGGEGTQFAAEDIVVMYEDGKPETVTVSRIVSIATDVLTLDAANPTIALDGTTATVHIFQAHAVPVGDIDLTNYFAVQVIQSERKTGRPIGFQFWKAAIGAGLTLDTNATDFASNDMQLKLLTPAASEYAAGGDLLHIANVIPNNPTGMLLIGGDDI